MKLETKLQLAAYLAFMLSIILGLIWFRFVWLTSQSVKAFTSTAATFQASHINQSSLRLALGKPVILHFIDKKCPCTKYSAPYIAELKKETDSSAVHIMSDDTSRLRPSNAASITRLLQVLPASPAVAIWSKEGKLSYFGPYSTGAYCGDGEDMVRYILKRLSVNENVRWIDQEAQGCMCKWQQGGHA